MAEEKYGQRSNEDLNALYRDADDCDKEIFAEMRSNLLLISGDHYNKFRSSFYRRVRDSRELTEEQKLRLTKNHTQKIVKTYVNNIISMAPGVGFEPKNANELQDQKAAELHHAVWRDACDKYHIESERVDDWCDDFVGIGEVAVKIIWDPNAGTVAGYHQMVSEDGIAQVDEAGNPVPDMSRPVMSGAFIFEDIYGFNLLRAPEAKSMSESPYLILRKMVDVKVLKGQFPDKEKEIQGSIDETMTVFDTNKNQFVKAGKQAMVTEFYFRPCMEFPRGYFYIKVKETILAEGELPGGIFPIVVRQLEKIQTTPRGRSIVKTMRPYQIEINRAASKIAEHQITLGDDKLLIQNNTKISEGVALPGVRSVNYTGMEPKVLAGRDGSQYLAYMQAQIVEMYQVLGVMEDSAENQNGQLDPYTMLFRAASQKKRFQRYIRRFEAFLCDVARTYLALAKLYLPEDAVIRAIGKPEVVNISEFKNSNDLSYEIIVEAQAEDIETKMGKQLVLNHALQYVGQKMSPDDIGKLMRQMPYANFDASFDDFTMNYDAATNLILSLERGETPYLNQADDFVYLAKRLVSRTRQADFKFLPEPIKAAFDQTIAACNQAEAKRAIQLQRLQSGFIPTGGFMAKCDLYVADPADPTKTKRMSFPSQSLEWLMQQIEAQGVSLDALQAAGPAVQAGVGAAMPENSPAPSQGQMTAPA